MAATTTARPPLPSPLRIVVGFLFVHAVKAGLAGAQAVLAGGPERPAPLEVLAPHLLYVAFDLLLAGQVLARGRGAIFWSVVYFSALALSAVATLVLDPVRWIIMTPIGRAREVASLAIDAGLVAAVLSKSARGALLR